MDLSKLSDVKLLSDTETLVKIERETFTALLHHLREINRRRLYSGMKCKDLAHYMISKLGYQEDQARRRIYAMNMMNSFSPEESKKIEEKLNDGSLCLTHLNLASALFHREEKHHGETIPSETRIEVLEALENTTTREAEVVILGLSSTPREIPQESLKPLTENLSEMRFVLTAEQLEKIEILKGLLAHSRPNIKFAELLDLLLDLGIKQFDPGKKEVRTYKKSADKSSDDRPRGDQNRSTNKNKDEYENMNENKRRTAPAAKSAAPRNISENPRFISRAVRQAVWQRDQSKCVNCGSTHALQIDHINPVAFGGESNLENLRLTCRNCNQRAAIKKMGAEKMQRHFSQKGILAGEVAFEWSGIS